VLIGYLPERPHKGVAYSPVGGGPPLGESFEGGFSNISSPKKRKEMGAAEISLGLSPRRAVSLYGASRVASICSAEGV
jgi:hypothetical protein